MRIIGQLVGNHDTERALGLLAAGDSLLQTIPPDTSLFLEFLPLRAELMAYGRDYAGAAEVLQLARSKLDRLQFPAGTQAGDAGVRLQQPDRPESCAAAHKCASAESASADGRQGEILARGHFATAISSTSHSPRSTSG